MSRQPDSYTAESGTQPAGAHGDAGHLYSAESVSASILSHSNQASV